MIYHRYWAFTGTSYEIKRTSFCTSVAFCSVLLFAAGQDRSESQHVSDKLLSYVLKAYKLVYKSVYGRVPDGKKKEL